jgi:hypothetical protein
VPKPWNKAGDTLFAAIVSGRNGARYHVLVEPLPQTDGWDWTVWRPGDAPEAARNGDAPSVEAATQAAKSAVREWDDRAVPGSSNDS